MLETPTPEEYRALYRLHGDTDFKTILGWLNRSLQGIRDRNDAQRDDIELRRGQGSALALKEIFEHVAQCGDALRAQQQSGTP